MTDIDPPLVSIAIPLYQSLRFVDVISENISGQDYPRLEFIISDRHCLDPAIELLRGRFSGDARVRFLSANDQLNWVEHCNLLLDSARGKYFLWMPHDDSYDDDWVSKLVAHLENHADDILAFGEMEVVTEDDYDEHGFIFTPPPVKPDATWSIRTSLKLLAFWNYGIAFRGVFRRDQVVQAGLHIRAGRDLAGSDVWWGFGMSLAGSISFVPDCRCTKRFSKTSAHANQRSGLLNAVDAFRIPRRYLANSPIPPLSKMIGTIGLFVIAVAWGIVLMLPLQDSIRKIRMKFLTGTERPRPS